MSHKNIVGKIHHSTFHITGISFNVSPCIFQFNDCWIPTHALFHIQHCISL